MGMRSDSSSTTLVPSSSCQPEEDNGGETRVRDLAQDSIIEIFARLPVKSLLRFKCVSKFWYSLILSPKFISMHSAHSPTVTLSSPGISTTTTTLSFQFGENLKEKELTLSSVEDTEIVGSSNGVVCLSLSKSPQMYALWNPATTQVRLISGAPMDVPIQTGASWYETSSVWYGSVFCFEPVTNGFKVVQIKLSFPEAAVEIRAQVNVFSTANNSWKCSNMVVPVPYRIVGSGLLPAGNATCVNGYIYWLLGWTFQDTYILSYNMSNEVFERIEIPSLHAFVHYSLASCKGSLALFAHFQTGSRHSFMSDEIEVWFLNDRGGANRSWSKILASKPCVRCTCVVGFFRKDGLDFILLYNNRNSSYYLFDPENGETMNFLTRKSIWWTFPYSESLVSLY